MFFLGGRISLISGQLSGCSPHRCPGAFQKALLKPSRLGAAWRLELREGLSTQLSGSSPTLCRGALRKAVGKLPAQLSESSPERSLEALQTAVSKLSAELCGGSPGSCREALQAAAEYGREQLPTTAESSCSLLSYWMHAVAQSTFPSSSSFSLSISLCLFFTASHGWFWGSLYLIFC